MKFPASTYDEKFASNGLLICADCGSINTKIRSEGIHCTECKNFRLYHNSINLQQIILTSNPLNVQTVDEKTSLM